MKKYIIIIAAITLSFPAFAKEKTMDDVNKEILSSVAEKNGWCRPKQKSGKPGQIVIEWVKDENGKCTKQIVRKIK